MKKKNIPEEKLVRDDVSRRMTNIIEKLKGRKPSQKDLLDLIEEEPPFPTFPSQAQKEEMKRRKSSPYL